MRQLECAHKGKQKQQPNMLLASVCLTSLLSSCSTQSGFPVSSEWQGTVSGEVYGTHFTLPISIAFKPSRDQENNPFNLLVNVGSEGQLGNTALFSALDYRAPSGRVTLQYFSIEGSTSSLVATLTDTHSGEAAVANQFYSPNAACASAPPQMTEVYCSMGQSQLNYFNTGAQISIKMKGDQLVGEIRGSGNGLTNVFPGSPINYSGQFTASRVR